MAAGNPIWDVHAAIWTMLEDKTVATDLVSATLHFTDLVNAANRLKFVTTDIDLIKREIAEGDLPEVAVVQAGFKFIDRMDSNTDALLLRWRIYVTTGEQPFGKFFDLQWAVMRQLQNWQDTLASLTWQEENYVKDSDILQAEDSLDNEFLNRHIEGWSSVWEGECALCFSHSKIIG